MIVDFSALNRQRAEQRLREGMRKQGPDFIKREMRRELKRAEKTRLRGVFTPTAPKDSE